MNETCYFCGGLTVCIQDVKKNQLGSILQMIKDILDRLAEFWGCVYFEVLSVNHLHALTCTI